MYCLQISPLPVLSALRVFFFLSPWHLLVSTVFLFILSNDLLLLLLLIFLLFTVILPLFGLSGLLTDIKELLLYLFLSIFFFLLLAFLLVLSLLFVLFPLLPLRALL